MPNEMTPIAPVPLTEDGDQFDETDTENEPPRRETDEATELPEEIEYDKEDDLPHPENDGADEE